MDNINININNNNNTKLKISKKTINNCLNGLRPNLSDYYSHNSLNSNSISDKFQDNRNKNKSFIYNRKRNCSIGNNNISNIYNSSNNASKEFSKNLSLNKTIQNLQSCERSKNVNKQISTKLNKPNYNTNINENKRNNLNKKNNKKLTVIQNFSRYKKKSTIINLYSETSEYFVNDENYNGENINKDRQIKDSNYINKYV